MSSINIEHNKIFYIISNVVFFGAQVKMCVNQIFKAVLCFKFYSLQEDICRRNLGYFLSFPFQHFPCLVKQFKESVWLCVPTHQLLRDWFIVSLQQVIPFSILFSFFSSGRDIFSWHVRVCIFSFHMKRYTFPLQGQQIDSLRRYNAV